MCARDIKKISSNSSSKILQVFPLVIAAAVGVVVAVPVVAPVLGLGLGLGLDPVYEVDPLERVELAPAPEELETEERQQQIIIYCLLKVENVLRFSPLTLLSWSEFVRLMISPDCLCLSAPLARSLHFW